MAWIIPKGGYKNNPHPNLLAGIKNTAIFRRLYFLDMDAQILI
jgi:hypothetical protein